MREPGRVRLTTSWDDGHPLDLRLADLLARYGIRGTFYVPRRNSEGRQVMSPADIRALSTAGFEVAAHTRDHQRLPGLSHDAARLQVEDGRRWLEDVLGAAVSGFAYPGGHPGRWGQQLARDAGFAYARTTRMLCLEPGADPFSMGTTAQVFPHRCPALLRNWLRNACAGRLDVLGDLQAPSRLTQGFAAVFDRAIAGAGGRRPESGPRATPVIHLWGHAWEIELHGLWAVLEDILALASERVAAADRLVNAELLR